ncbi:MAG: esterase family protein [Chitinophagaceae bacterium]|nr:esterase family protein [Chitinophagaceae bacterium]
MKKSVIFFLLFCITVCTFAAKVDTVFIYSQSMHKEIKCVVIKPGGYKKKKYFPVVYLLHGYSGDFSNWITKVPQLKKYADDFNMLIVCPDGAFSSWYFDSPIDSTYKYETHVATEVISYIDKKYKTIPDKSKRAITGLSMGGHGAMFLAFRHQDIFGAAGSMSGGVDLKESKNRFDITKRIGDTLTHAKEWHDLTVVNLIENYPNTNLKLIVDCGVNDIFINGNRRLHNKLVALHIAHDYIEREGEHNWNYWSNAVQYQLFFFSKYFNGK